MLKSLFDQLTQLHLNLSYCQIPPNQYTDLQTYVTRGVSRIQKKYGPDLPFLPKLEAFINRLAIGSIRQGVRHGDIQETNVCLQDEAIIFVDGDDVHFGYLLMDYIQGAVMYLDQDSLGCTENQAIVEAVWQQAKGEVSGLTKQGVKYLLARVMLGSIQGGDIQPNKETLQKFLLDLEYFCESDQ